MRFNPRRLLAFAALIGLAVPACNRQPHDQARVNGEGPEGDRFTQAWTHLEGREVFYIEDDHGEGLMGRVRRARARLPAEDGHAETPSDPDGTDDNPAGASNLPETISFADVSQVVKRHLANVKSCYIQLSRSGPTPSGRAILSFTVEPHGGVDNVKVEAPAFAETPLPNCVASQVQHWSFPPSKQGGLAVSYPLVFVGG